MDDGGVQGASGTPANKSLREEGESERRKEKKSGEGMRERKEGEWEREAES